MVIMGLLNAIFSFVGLLVSIFPNIDLALDSISVMPELISFIKIGLYFTGANWIYISFSVFTSWYGIILSWSVVEWIYKKIPGVE